MIKRTSLILLLISLIFLTGCNLPFSTASRVSSYTSKVEEIFKESQSRLDQVGENLTIKEFNQEKLQEDVSSLEEAISQEQASYNQIKNLNPPQPAKELESKLDQYYKEELEALNDSKDLYSYLLSTEEYWNQDPAYISKLENLNYSSLDQLATKLENLAEQARDDLRELRNIEANKTTQGYHEQLIKIYKGTSDFFSDLVQAVEDEDVSQIESAADRLEEVATSASNAFSDLKLSEQFSNYSEELNSLSNQINSEIDRLKKEY